MKKLFTLLSLLTVGAITANAQLTFDYSYNFLGGPVVSGTLMGTLSGDNVMDISDVTVSVNGNPLTITSVTGSDGTGAAVVSLIADDNNFDFLASDGEIFFMIPHGSYGPPPFNNQPGTVAGVYYISGQYGNENITLTESSDWSLTEVPSVPSAVPEPSTYLSGALLLLPLGVSTFRSFRKTRTAKAV
jgi:hypothetical protein